MKIDNTPLNRTQSEVMKDILSALKDTANCINVMLEHCPGLIQKGYRIEFDIDTKYESVGNAISIQRQVVKDGEIAKDSYHIQKGFGEYGKSWEENRCLCSGELDDLLKNKPNDAGTETGEE